MKYVRPIKDPSANHHALMIKSFILILYFLFNADAAIASNNIDPGGGQNAWTIYAFGNNEALYGVLNGVQALTKSGMFVHLIDMTLMLGLGWSLFLAAAKGKDGFNSTSKWMLSVGFTVRLMLGFTVNIGLEDYITPANNKVITAIPAIIGIPASILSQLGHGIAALIDEAYSIPTGMPITLTLTGGSKPGASGAPFNMFAQMLLDGTHFRISDPYLKNSLSHFIVDCMVPLIANNKISTNDLLTRPNIWRLFNQNELNPAIMTVYYGIEENPAEGNSGKVLSCLETYQNLQADLKTLESSVVDKRWGNDISSGLANTLFNTILNYSAQNSQYKTTGSEYLIQASMIDMLQGPAPNLIANLTNSNTFLNSIHTHQAEQETTASWMMAAKIFSATFGYIYAGLEVLVYAIGPISLILMLLPGMGITVFSSYLQLLAWLPMTLILLAITNNILTSWTQHVIAPGWEHYHGLSVMGQTFISSRAAKMVEVGAWLNSIVPMLAWALISKGTITIDDVLTNNKSLDFVSQAASRVTTGEITLNNHSISNTSANSFDTTMRTDMGALPVTMNMSGTATNAIANLGGRSFMQNNASASNNALTTKMVSTENYGEALTSTGFQNTYASNRNLIKSANSAVESATAIATTIEANAKGGLVSGVAAYLLQQKLAQDNGLSQQDANAVAKQLTSATVASANAAKSEALGNQAQSQNYAQIATKEIDNAYHYLADKFGGGNTGKVAASVLIAAGLSGAIFASAPEEMTAGVVTSARMLGQYMARSFGSASEASGVSSDAAAAILKAGVTDWEAGNTSAIKPTEALGAEGKSAQANKNTVDKKASATTGFANALKNGITGSFDKKTVFTNSTSHINVDIANKEDFASMEQRSLLQKNKGTLLRSTTTTTIESALPEINPHYSKVFQKKNYLENTELIPINHAKSMMDALKNSQQAEANSITDKVLAKRQETERKFNNATNG